ncbi:hypothetical protein CA982_24505 [Gordonia lacunae]|uniref:Uncharacterized protein n=2 Tax=Gordonia lacunae TaxID=417102 RepID=A0A243Q3M0_9ACTN|nr:hypothetical protein CA982_24505 [Gordonia lacunae]
MTVIDMTMTGPTMPAPGAATATPAGFATAIAMAEAAVDRNPLWWNEIRVNADDPLDAAFCSSTLLGALLQSAAHRLGVPAADVWAHIRRTGELPL